MTSSLLSCTPSPFFKGVYSKKKEFAPCRSKFFPSEVVPFSEGRQKKTVVTSESVSNLLNNYIDADSS